MLNSSKNKVAIALVALIASFASAEAAPGINIQSGESLQMVSEAKCNGFFPLTCAHAASGLVGRDAQTSLGSVAESNVHDIATPATEALESHGEEGTSPPPLENDVSLDTGSKKGRADNALCASCDASAKNMALWSDLERPLRTEWIVLPLVLGVGTFTYRASRKVV